MARTFLIAAVLIGSVLVVPLLSQSRESREHTQILADIRMLQEQQQRLQLTVNQLIETLKNTTAAIAAQGADNTKLFANIRSEMGTLTTSLSQLRSLVDQANRDIGRVSPELDAIRQGLAVLLKYNAQLISMLEPVNAIPGPPDPTATPPATSPTTPPGGTPPTMLADSPNKLFNLAMSSYGKGDYESAIQAFEEFLKVAPTAADAPLAQLHIGNSYSHLGQWKTAIEAFRVVTVKYRDATTDVAEAYYGMGRAFEQVKDIQNAIRHYNIVVNQFKGTVAAIRAEESLKRIKK